MKKNESNELTWRGCGGEGRWMRCRRFARRRVRTGRWGGCFAPPAELRRVPPTRGGFRTRKGTRTRRRRRERCPCPWLTHARNYHNKKEKREWSLDSEFWERELKWKWCVRYYLSYILLVFVLFLPSGIASTKLRFFFFTFWLIFKFF